MMKTGILQRRWAEDRPPVYDKETSMVTMDIIAEDRTDEEGETVSGFSFVQVQIDSLINYGHIKCQLIEAGYPPKDEFGLVMNAVEDIIDAVGTSEDFSAFKTALADAEDVQRFVDFCAYRQMCANAARAVVNEYRQA